MQKVRIATRRSPLALWQAYHVKQQLETYHTGIDVELVPMVTRGDILLDTPLAKIGGKGLFVKELELAMLDGRADIAVHSMKDVPMEFPDGLGLQIICERDDPRDAFVSNHYAQLEQLPQGAIVGTSSLRRQCQLRHHRPDLQIKDLRGNVNSRLAKLDAGEYDAIILASAGLKRLDMASRIRANLAPEVLLPSGGQGAIGIECRINDSAIHQLLTPLEHNTTRVRVTAERAMNKALQGGCQVPIGCYATLKDGILTLRGLVGSIDGALLLTASTHGRPEQAEALGIELAKQLIGQGAEDILRAVYG